MKALETIKSTELLNLITVTRIGDILNTKAKFADYYTIPKNCQI